MSNLLLMEMTSDEYYSKECIEQYPCLVLFEDNGLQNLRFITGRDRSGLVYYEYGFAINDKRIYYDGTRPITREMFIDLVKSDYPDCFEWFLFNPGWF